MVQLSHPYMTTRKTIVLTIRTFVGKVISLLYKTETDSDFEHKFMVIKEESGGGIN